MAVKKRGGLKRNGGCRVCGVKCKWAHTVNGALTPLERKPWDGSETWTGWELYVYVASPDIVQRVHVPPTQEEMFDRHYFVCHTSRPGHQDLSTRQNPRIPELAPEPEPEPDPPHPLDYQEGLF